MSKKESFLEFSDFVDTVVVDGFMENCIFWESDDGHLFNDGKKYYCIDFRMTDGELEFLAVPKHTKKYIMYGSTKLKVKKFPEIPSLLGNLYTHCVDELKQNYEYAQTALDILFAEGYAI